LWRTDGGQVGAAPTASATASALLASSAFALFIALIVEAIVKAGNGQEAHLVGGGEDGFVEGFLMGSGLLIGERAGPVLGLGAEVPFDDVGLGVLSVEAVEADVGPAGVVGVEGDAVELVCFADADLDLLPGGAFDAAQGLAALGEEFAGDARGDDHLDA